MLFTVYAKRQKSSVSHKICLQSQNPLIKADASVNESSNIKQYMKRFCVDVKYFEGKLFFTQIVNLKSAAKTNIAGTTIEYMACNNTTLHASQKVPFDITLQ